MKKSTRINELFLYEEMKKGREYAFDYFFNYYYAGLCVYAQKIILFPDQEAKDIVQEVFVKFWNDRRKLNINRSIRSYLFMSVKNKCLDCLRKKTPKKNVREVFGELDFVDDFFEPYIFSELQSLFNKSLSKLPPRCREVFEMSRIQGLKNREIAAELKLSEKTIENQITKALRILKVELNDFLPFLIVFGFSPFLG